MIRIGILSFWHVHARDYAKQAHEHPDTEIVAVWDDDQARGTAAAQKWGGHFYSKLDELLRQPDIDAVIVTTPTNRHREVMTAAAQARKHIFTEKVLAPTLHEALAIKAAVDQSGVKLIVSLPRLNAGYTEAIQALIGGGTLGQLTTVHTRVAHNGAVATSENPKGWLPDHFYNLEECLGGAMIDLGCHPMYLARLFLGMPVTVSAQYGYITGRAVEDNAVAVLGYETGAMGLVEAGFANRYAPFTIEVLGTEGSLLYGTPEATLLLRSGEGAAGTTWQPQPIPADRPSAFHQWVTHIQQGTPGTDNIQAALDLTALMEAANTSAAEHQVVRLDSLAR